MALLSPCNSRESGNLLKCHCEERSKPAPAKAGEAISKSLNTKYISVFVMIRIEVFLNERNSNNKW